LDRSRTFGDVLPLAGGLHDLEPVGEQLQEVGVTFLDRRPDRKAADDLKPRE